jgi:molybdopterin converting factor small subunit
VTVLELEIQLFSVLRERLRCDRLQVQLPPGADGSTLLDVLGTRYPDIASYRSVIRLAVNESYEQVGYRFVAGDRVALITPVSGG